MSAFGYILYYAYKDLGFERWTLNYIKFSIGLMSLTQILLPLSKMVPGELSLFYPGTKIFIFDRYGKLLKQISSTGAGWDGPYNGYLMPSDDYWFTVDYAEGTIMKQFKSHFAMKR